MSAQHAGTYICRAQNKEGSTDVKVQVRVEGGPSGGALPRATVSVEEIAAVQGQTITMQCQATGGLVHRTMPAFLLSQAVLTYRQT